MLLKLIIAIVFVTLLSGCYQSAPSSNYYYDRPTYNKSCVVVVE